MRTSGHLAAVALGLLLECWSLAPASAAVFVLESFDDDDAGWFSRDGDLVVNWGGGVGNAPGSIHGLFSYQDAPSPQLDAFRIDHTALRGPWVGDYNTLYPAFTTFTFDFMAADIAPSSFIIQMSDGLNTFIRNLLPQVSGVGGFVGITVPLSFDAGWLGGTATEFSSMLGNVTFIDLQLARNTTAAQNYYIDNFALNDDELPPDPSTVSVPEPSTLQFVTLSLILVVACRKRFAAGKRGK